MSFTQSTAAARWTLVALSSLAWLAAAGCGNSSSSVTAPSSAGGLVTIFVASGVFSPNPMTMRVGQQVNWKNNDATPHTATSTGFDTGSIAPMSAADAPITMSAAGTFAFHCSLHAGETGTIVVQP